MATSDPNPYPIDALGVVVDAARALKEITQAPSAICGQDVLAAACPAVQGHANVQIGPRIHPISAYFLTIAPPGAQDHHSRQRKASRPRHRQPQPCPVQCEKRKPHAWHFGFLLKNTRSAFSPSCLDRSPEKRRGIRRALARSIPFSKGDCPFFLIAGNK